VCGLTYTDSLNAITKLCRDADEGSSLSVTVTVGSIDQGADGPPSIRCDLHVESHTGDKVLGKAQAVIRPV
jgi:hypothetical protein